MSSRHRPEFLGMRSKTDVTQWKMAIRPAEALPVCGKVVKERAAQVLAQGL